MLLKKKKDRAPKDCRGNFLDNAVTLFYVWGRLASCFVLLRTADEVQPLCLSLSLSLSQRRLGGKAFLLTIYAAAAATMLKHVYSSSDPCHCQGYYVTWGFILTKPYYEISCVVHAGCEVRTPTQSSLKKKPSLEAKYLKKVFLQVRRYCVTCCNIQEVKLSKNNSRDRIGFSTTL